MGDNALVNGVNLLSIHDELVLHEMLDKSEDYEDRKKIRARLKDVLAELRAKREEMIAKRENEREEILRNRVRDAEEQKRRTLAMYDAMAKSAPAGGNKVLDINYLKEGKQGAPVENKKVDLVEEAIRQRQREANERKAKVLAAYDQAAKSGPAGSARFIDFDSVKPTDAKHVSPREKFQRMDSSSSTSTNGTKPSTGITFSKPAASNVTRSPTAIKEMLLNWVKSKTKEYKNISVDNFSTSWNDGMVFCALIHHFYPDAFDYDSLDAKNRRHNFDLAFRVAEEKGDVAPLLEVDDMVMMKKPDWKCVFTYVQSIYRRFHNVD